MTDIDDIEDILKPNIILLVVKMFGKNFHLNVKGLTNCLNRLKKLHFVHFGLSFANPCISDRN